MKYIFRNIKSLLCNEPTVAILMILCIVVSSTILYFSYGLYQNYSIKLINERAESSELPITIINNERITKSKLKECILSLPDDVKNTVGMFYVTANVEPFITNSFGLDIRFSVDGSKIAPCDLFSESLKSEGLVGDYFTYEQEALGENVTIIPQNTLYLQFTDVEEKDGHLYVSIQNKPFLVIGKVNSYPMPIIPFETLNDETTFQGRIIILMKDDKYLSKSEYSIISECFMKWFGNDISIPELKLPDEDSATLYRMVIMISIIISFLSAINLVMLYQYILQTRRRKYALFRILGCSKYKILLLSVGECITIILPCYLLAFVLYSKCMIPFFIQVYPNMVSSNSRKCYFIISLCYFNVSLIVIITTMIRFLFTTWIIQDIRRK